jgi:transposase
MGITLPDARQLSDEVLEALRLRALRGCEMGFTEVEVAEMLGLARETVSRWWSAYCAGGVGGLPGGRTGRPQGSGRTLSDKQGEHLRALIDRNSPEELGIAAPLWSRQAVRELIHREYHFWMPIRTVGEYLRRWGYTAKRPSRKAKRQDPDEVQEWLEQTYPKIEAQAQQEHGIILFGDETGVEADHCPRLGYSPKGERATMKVPDSHIRVNLISAISNDGELYFMTYLGSMDAARFISFLQSLPLDQNRKIFLIVDRLSAHDAEEVYDWLATRKHLIEMFLMPRRAPELNPGEYLNNDLKGNVHNAGLPNNKQQLLSRVESFMQRLLHLPGHVMNYFNHPDTLYAAQMA